MEGKTIETPKQWTKYVEDMERAEKAKRTEAATLLTATAESLPLTPPLEEPTQREEEEEVTFRGKKAVGPNRKRAVTFTGDIADPIEVSSDSSDEEQDDVDLDLVSSSEHSIEINVPDVQMYICKPAFDHIQLEEKLALCKAACRFLEDRIELQKLARGLPTKNSKRIGMTYKKSK